jgi:hypothetical protein
MKLKSPYLVKPHTKIRLSHFPTDDSGDFSDKAEMQAAMGSNEKN